MAEKGDIPSDQVSLPPTYAPSETFTESPPPAYKRSGMAAVRVAKIVCATMLFMTLIIGFTVVAHKWIQLRECDCSWKETAPGQALPLIALETGQLKEVKEEPIIKKNFVPHGETEINENFINLGNEESKEMKKIMLPIDMLLGNPSLAGKDMPCNVEKRRQKIADGIFTEAVIVTCENEKKIDLPFSPLSSHDQPTPPMSLINHIIKTLATRHKLPMRHRDDMERMPNSFRKKPFPFGKMIQFPIKHSERPNPSSFSPGMVHIVPLKNFGMNRPHTIPELKELPMPFPQSIFQSQPQPFIKRISIRPMNLNQNGLQHIRPDSIINPFPKFNMPNVPQGMFNSPPVGGPHVRIIRLPKNEEAHNENEHNEVAHHEIPHKPLFPLSLNPIMKLFPMRKGRVLRVMPSPIPAHEALSDYPEQEENFNQFQRPIEIIDHGEDNLEENVPEASGRSLPSPRVDLPGINFLRLPGQPPFLRFPGPRVMTHMELRRAPQSEIKDISDIFPPPVLPVEEEEEVEEFGPPKTHTVIQSAPEPIFRSEHPIIFQSPPEEQEETINEAPLFSETEPISLSQLQPRFFVPPPPRFAREGRFNQFAEINPEAEVYTEPHQEQTNNHHLTLNK